MEISSKLFSYENLFFDKQLCVPAGKLFQVSELSVVRGGEINAHIQECDEITYAVSGKAKIFFGDDSAEMVSGQIHYIKKGVYHRIEADPNENFRYICIGFIIDENYESNRVYLQKIQGIQSLITEDDGNIQLLCQQLMNEFYIRDEQSNIMVNCYLSQILISFCRILEKKNRMQRNKISGTTSNFPIYHVLRYIDREYMNITNIKAIADELSYSEYYLSHLFREKMDITIKDYLTNKKMLSAEALLKESNMSIQEIAEQLNYSSAHSFSLAFKRHMSISPDGYRKAYRKQFSQAAGSSDTSVPELLTKIER